MASATFSIRDCVCDKPTVTVAHGRGGRRQREGGMGTFTAGLGRVDITPPLSAPHASWGAQVHVLPDGADCPLYATVLVVSDGTTMAAYAELEVVILSHAESQATRAAVAAELGIDPANVRCSVSHNHAGPPPSAWNWTKQGQEALEGYFHLLPSLVAGAARTAKLSMAPAQIGVGRGESHVAVNRRETDPTGRTVTGVDFDGPIDPEVFVARIDDLDGEPIAAIVGYTMHPTFLGPSNRLVSSDWPGEMRRVFEQVTGAPCIFAQGATGDVGPGPKGFTDSLRDLRSVGGQVGCEAARVWLATDVPAVAWAHDRVQESGAPLSLWKRVPVEESPVVVQAVSTTVELPLREQPHPDDQQKKVDAAQADLDRLKAAGAPAKEIEAATFVAKRANMAMSRAKAYYGRTSTQVQLHLLRIGPVVLAGTEGEPFSAIGKQIKAASPFPATWFGGYTGGWAGYIPTPEEYARDGYEVYTSPFPAEAAAAMADQTIAALKELAARG
jgi:hypothetical protein